MFIACFYSSKFSKLLARKFLRYTCTEILKTREKLKESPPPPTPKILREFTELKKKCKS